MAELILSRTAVLAEYVKKSVGRLGFILSFYLAFTWPSYFLVVLHLVIFFHETSQVVFFSTIKDFQFNSFYLRVHI